MARPSARVEERVNSRCDAIVISRDRQAAIAAAERELGAARRDLHRAEHRVVAAERAMHAICVAEEQLILNLRAANELDCAA